MVRRGRGAPRSAVSGYLADAAHAHQMEPIAERLGTSGFLAAAARRPRHEQALGAEGQGSSTRPCGCSAARPAQVTTVTAVAVDTAVVVRLTPGIEIVSIITHESAESLNLKAGDAAHAVIKAANVTQPGRRDKSATPPSSDCTPCNRASRLVRTTGSSVMTIIWSKNSFTAARRPVKAWSAST